MKSRYIFTVATGRCGQNSLSELLSRHVSDSYVGFEEPDAPRALPWVLGDIERRFRRKFIETHELLGRGKVLHAFESGDLQFINKVAAERLALIERKLETADAHIYIDVSKYFARGLHSGFLNQVPKASLIHLVRDPIANMRSFLNRDKNFELDNNLPNASSNLLQMDSDNMNKGELYLWAWCELYLRYLYMADEDIIEKSVEIRTEQIDDSKYLNEVLDDLCLEHSPVETMGRLNTNVGRGLKQTQVSSSDVQLFEEFRNKLPPDAIKKISYLENYEPSKLLA